MSFLCEGRRDRTLCEGGKCRTLLGRRPSRVYRHLLRTPALTWHFIRTLFLVKRPLSFFFHYLVLKSPSDRLIEFRNGVRITISSHPDDIATVFLMFVRRDYGAIAKGSKIVDIGGNIGTFAVYAARSGAGRVYSYEPGREAYNLLQKNIQMNGMLDCVVAERMAVADCDGGTVAFPIASSPDNRMVSAETPPVGYDLVPTTTLDAILARHKLDFVDCVKIDCEGAEYQIVLNTPDAVWSRIKEIKMEYHSGRPEVLIHRLKQTGYVLVKQNASTETAGHLWFRRY